MHFRKVKCFALAIVISSCQSNKVDKFDFEIGSNCIVMDTGYDIGKIDPKDYIFNYVDGSKCEIRKKLKEERQKNTDVVLKKFEIQRNIFERDIINVHVGEGGLVLLLPETHSDGIPNTLRLAFRKSQVALVDLVYELYAAGRDIYTYTERKFSGPGAIYLSFTSKDYAKKELVNDPKSFATSSLFWLLKGDRYRVSDIDDYDLASYYLFLIYLKKTYDLKGLTTNSSLEMIKKFVELDSRGTNLTSVKVDKFWEFSLAEKISIQNVDSYLDKILKERSEMMSKNLLEKISNASKNSISIAVFGVNHLPSIYKSLSLAGYNVIVLSPTYADKN